MNRNVRFTQGDVTLKPIAALPKNVNLTLIEDKIVQPSETHGKFHRFAPEADVKVFDTGTISLREDGSQAITPDTQKFVVVGTDGAVLFHGTQYDLKPSTETQTDHAAVAVPPGIYEVGIALEYDYDRMEEVRVVD